MGNIYQMIPATSRGYENLTVDEYKNRFVDSRQPHLLLDVRTAPEFEQARIPGAWNIPLEQLAGRANEVVATANDNPVVIVCRTGVRSIIGAQILRHAGVNGLALYNLDQGTVGWAAQRWPLASGPAE